MGIGLGSTTSILTFFKSISGRLSERADVFMLSPPFEENWCICTVFCFLRQVISQSLSTTAMGIVLTTAVQIYGWQQGNRLVGIRARSRIHAEAGVSACAIAPNSRIGLISRTMGGKSTWVVLRRRQKLKRLAGAPTADCMVIFSWVRQIRIVTKTTSGLYKLRTTAPTVVRWKKRFLSG
jgi:hypothetical protein